MKMRPAPLLAAVIIGTGALLGVAHAGFGISIKALTAAAIRSEVGFAKSPIDDRPATMMRMVAQTNAQTMGEVKVLERYTDDCAKIVLSLIQPDALKRDGSRGVLQVNTQLNVCTNGQPYKVSRK